MPPGSLSRSSVDGGVTWLELYDATGTEVTLASAAAGHFIEINSDIFESINDLKVRSGTAACAGQPDRRPHADARAAADLMLFGLLRSDEMAAALDRLTAWRRAGPLLRRGRPRHNFSFFAGHGAPL